MVRLDMVSGFLRIKGFKHLIAYLRARVTTLEFPHMRLISVLIQATKDLVNHDEEDLVRMVQELTYEMANAVMNHMWSDLGQVFTTGFENDVQCVIKGLYDLCQLSSESNPKILADFFAFWRSLALKWITSESLPVKLLGWDEISQLVKESEKNCPPPMTYNVSGAGSDFVNGRYDIDPKLLSESGYVKLNTDLQYHRQIPADYADEDVAGKTLTLLLDTKSHRWFLSMLDDNFRTDFYRVQTNDFILYQIGLPSARVPTLRQS